MTNLKKKDRFWSRYVAFTATVFGALLLFLIGILIIGSSKHDLESDILNLANTQNKEPAFIEMPEIFSDALAAGWEDWSWGSNIDLQSAITAGYGRSIKVNLLEPYAGFMIHAPGFDTTSYRTIDFSLLVSGDQTDNEIFIEFTDQNGNSKGSQPLSWYVPQRTFKPNIWQAISIPLGNLNSIDTLISGISFTSQNPVLIYFDNINFSTRLTYFPPWEVQQEASEEPQTYAFGSYRISLPKTLLGLPYDSDFLLEKDDWQALNGDLAIDFGKMHLNTGEGANYGMYRLLGSELWTDYKYTVFIDWAMGDSVSLVSRYSPENYLSCSFFDDGENVILYQTKDGQNLELQSSPNYLPKRKYNWRDTRSLGMEVRGQTISCLSNDRVKLSYKLSPGELLFGGVALEIWSPENNKSQMSISKVTVE